MTERNRTSAHAPGRWRLLMPALAFVALHFTASVARAEPRTFDVPAQPMERALRVLAEAAGAQVLFSTDVTAGMKSRPVRGNMEIADALAAAIAGRGLEVRPIGPNAFVVRPAAAAPALKPVQARRPPTPSEEIVVTGARPDAMARRLDTPYAITVVGASRLAARNSAALADLISLTPGFWVESSGGEASNNIRARGVPLDGFASVAVFEDGLPVQHDSGLGFLNPDQALRAGFGLARVEVVRGGPAAIMASQAPGGLINAINRRPTRDFQGQIKTQTSDFGGGRVDGFVSGPIGSVLLSGEGYWRQDPGVRDAGFDANRGGGVRVALAGQWNSTTIDAALKHIDDRVAFYLPVPLQVNSSGKIEGASGFDARRGTLLGPDLIGFDPTRTQDPSGPSFDIADGTHVRLTQATIKTGWTPLPDWSVEVALRATTSRTNRNGLFPRTPQTAESRAAQVLTQAQASFPRAQSVGYRLVSDGSTWVAGDDSLIIDAIASRISAPLDEVIGQATLSGRLDGFGFENDVSFGLYFAHSDLLYQRRASTILLEANENARRLDILALDSAGAPLGAVTQAGVVRYGVQYDAASARQQSAALFGRWKASLGPRWTLDAGLRWEAQAQAGSVERKVAVDLGAVTPADDAVLRGGGVRQPFDANFRSLNATVGARYALSEDASVFVRASRANRLPSVSDFYGDPSGAAAKSAPTESLDFGISIERAKFSAYAVLFYIGFDGFPFNETLIDPMTGAVRAQVSFASSQTTGLEFEGRLFAASWLTIDASLTAQDPRFADFAERMVVDRETMIRDYSGRQLIRVPRLMARISPTVTLPKSRHEAGLVIEHFGERFADAANRVRLPPYTIVSGHVRLRLGAHADLLISGTNLTNELGLTEGNPRAGQVASLEADQRLFSARPIFGRTFRAALTIDF